VLLWDESHRLHHRRYHAAVILRPDHWWGAFLADLVGIPRRFGFAVEEGQPFLTHALPVPTGHALASSQDLARLAIQNLIGREPTSRTPNGYVDPSFSITRNERVRAAALLSHDGTSPLVSIHPGAGAPLKNWPAERWAAVASALQARAGA